MIRWISGTAGIISGCTLALFMKRKHGTWPAAVQLPQLPLGLLALISALPAFLLLPQDIMQSAGSGLLLTVMFWIALIDYGWHIIPNKVLMGMVMWRILHLTVLAWTQPETASFLSAGAGMAAAGSTALLVYWISRGAVGAGDVKLLAVLGLFLGMRDVFTMALCALVIGSLAGGVAMLRYRTVHVSLPFGPCLYAALLLIGAGL